MNMYDDIKRSGIILRDYCHTAAFNAGWWHFKDRNLIKEVSGAFFPLEKIYADAFISQKLCLIHSEISEAMEGHRKDLMDDKLPHRKMIEVELADALIRIFDLAGAMGMDIGGAIAEKMAYNAKREDHKPENRAKAGGKSF